MSSLKVNYVTNDANSDNDLGLEQAHRLVKSIFHQIVDGDAPSDNFENFNNNINSLVGGKSNNFGCFSRHETTSSNRSIQRLHVKMTTSGTINSTTTRVSLSNHSEFATSSDNLSSQSDYNDVTSTCTASEPSILSSCSGMITSPVLFASPKPTTSSSVLRFPPRPRSHTATSSSSQLSDTSNHSSLKDWNCATSYSIGASLMGVNSLADYCSRTMQLQNQQASHCTSEKEQREKREVNPTNNHHNCRPTESEQLSTRDEESKVLTSVTDQKNMILNLAAPTDCSPTPRMMNNGRSDATSLDLGIACDDMGFPNKGIEKENDRMSDIQMKDSLRITASWNTETQSFSFEDAGRDSAEEMNFFEDPSIAPSNAFSKDSAPVGQILSHTGNTSGSTAVKKRRMMFGSEYARILSLSTPHSQSSTDQHGLIGRPIHKVKRSSSTMSNKIKAKLSNTVSIAESHASSVKESVMESCSGGGVLSLDDCPQSIATAAITDVIITSGSDIPPRGYYRAFPLGEEPNKNTMVPGRKQARLYLNVKKEPSWERAAQRPCVTAFCVIYPDRNEFVPPGFSVVRHNSTSHENGNKKKDGRGGGGGTKTSSLKRDELGSSESSAANINPSSTGERVYICYRRSREGNPITGVICLRPSNGDTVPEGYTVLERTPRNFVADMSAKQESPLFLAYRQRLANLECLRPLPLVLSASRTELKAYYCTGCTVVPSDVGKFHIMDRSTHSLVSTSSAKSRLNLIQSSRDESETAVPAWVSSTSARDASPINKIQDTPISVESHSQDNDYTSDRSFASVTTSYSSLPSPALNKSLFRSDASSLSNLDALHFIPPIDCSKRSFQHEDATHHSESVLQSRIAAITPILTSCYIAHGGSSLLAVEGLIKLLSETDFFAQDIVEEDCSLRLTILDLTIQVVCDIATSSARETYFRSCVDFVANAVRYADGKLSDRTIGYVLRFYLFVFFFGASISTNGWPFHKARYEDQVGIVDDSLLPENMDQAIEFGAPQAAAIAMKDFVTILLSRIGKGLEMAKETTSCSSSHVRQTLPFLSEKARVDVASYAQLAMYKIHRSGGSELFWHDMTNSIGQGLFRQDISPNNRDLIHSNIISFAVLATIVKNCSGKVRLLLNADPVPRDVASKLLSFELLLHFLKMWHVVISADIGMSETARVIHEPIPAFINDKQEYVTTMNYVVRRLVVPTLLSNTSAAIEDYRVYRRVLHVISQLWCSPFYRSQMKIELAILIEHFFLKVLSIGPQVNHCREGEFPTSSGEMPSLLQQQLDVLDELKNWFTTNATDVLSIHLNYDNNDMIPVSSCRLMSKLCEALSTLAEQCGAIICENVRSATINGVDSSSRRSVEPMMNVRESSQLLRKKSFDTISVIAKSWMDCAISSCKQEASGSTEGTAIDEKSAGLGLSPQLVQVPSFGDENIVDYWKTSIEKRKAPLQPLLLTSSYDIESHSSTVIKSSMSEESSNQAQNKQETLDVAFELISTKGLKKGIDYLIAVRLLLPSPRHISAFLRIHLSSIDPSVLGEYLGEGGVDGSDADFFNLIRFNFARATSFVGMTIEQALRYFLTNCGFRLPGEAQKIDRIVSVFSQCYWEDNAGDFQKCPFPDQDTVFLVSFAIIMLNTDLHKSHAAKGKTPKRMTKTEFITNLRGVYDGVLKFRDYIYSIYDSIESSPIAIFNHYSSKSKRTDHEHGHYSLPFKEEKDLSSALVLWVKSVEPAQELLRTLAVRNEDFSAIDETLKDKISLKDLTCCSFSTNWHHIHAAINATIDNAHVDIAGLGCCIDVLEYSLCAASYLNMGVERSAFSKLLSRVNRFNKQKAKNEDVKCKKPGKHGASESRSEDHINFEDVDQVRRLTKKLHIFLSVDDAQIKTMKEVARKIRNGDILLNDPSRSFVREGDLIKHHQLAARNSTYHFFLFSDVLVYAHKSSCGDFKVHEELPLHMMKIEDAGNSSSIVKHNSFYIHHPNKSFLVTANNNAEKQEWMDDINNSIRRELKRKAKIEKSRIEAARRAEA